MHGIIRPESDVDDEENESFAARSRAKASRHRYFLLLVILPTLVLAAYYYLVASDQYESGADFVVRRADSVAVGGGGVGQLLGFEFGTSSTISEAYIVEEYLLSHEAVQQLRQEDDLVSRFRRPGIDVISRLWFAKPAPELLLKYYRGKVRIEQDSDTGITHLRVHAFTQDDAYAIARKLLLLGEQRINELNERTVSDLVTTAARELEKAEASLVLAQSKLTGLRRLREDIDPAGTGRAQVGLVTTLTGELVTARARLQAMGGAISRDSPQYRALEGRVAALTSQIRAQSAHIAGQGKSTAGTLGDYEDLVIRREHAAKRFSAAAGRYEEAKAEVSRKELYLVRIVDANKPVKSLYPERLRIVLSAFAGLLVFYLIGSLLVAGVKEHHL